MDESTRRRMESAVRAVNTPGAAPVQNVGGYGGGMGGAWGEAATGRNGGNEGSPAR